MHATHSKLSETYFISAGEYSGDLLAAELVSEIAQNSTLSPIGMTGPAMRGQGVLSLADMKSVSAMGITEVLKKAFAIKKVEQELLKKIELLNPRFAILVDFPGFHFRLAEQLKLRGIPVYQFVAPKLWAWGAKRVKKLR